MVFALLHRYFNVQFPRDFPLHDFPIQNDSLCFFPRIHISHIISIFLINGNRFTTSFICKKFRPPKFKCPNLKCHSHESSCTLDQNTAYNSGLPSFSFLELRALTFSSFEQPTLASSLYALNEVSECTYFFSQITCVVFFSWMVSMSMETFCCLSSRFL